jgi:excinuclease ABC subunit A
VRNADWIIDLGPEGGEDGGQIIAEGSPEEVARIAHSHTGEFLRRYYESSGTASEDLVKIAAEKNGANPGPRKKKKKEWVQ